MLHKLSMINFIKFSRWSLAMCDVMAFLGDIMLHYNRQRWTKSSWCTRICRLGKPQRPHTKCLKVHVFIFSYFIDFSKRSWHFRIFCPALDAGCRPLQVGTRVVSPRCHYNICITQHYNSNNTSQYLAAHWQFKCCINFALTSGNPLSLILSPVIVNNDNRYLYQSYFEVGPIKKFVSQRSLECGRSVRRAEWHENGDREMRKHHF